MKQPLMLSAALAVFVVGCVAACDGRSIVFASNRDGNSELYVMNADGSRQRRLTRDPAEDDFPVWSPKNP
jgi:hypothetical protein